MPSSYTAGANPISIEYYQGGGGQAMFVQYSTDGTNWTTLPNSMLLSSLNFGALPPTSPVVMSTGTTLERQYRDRQHHRLLGRWPGCRHPQ